MAHFLPFGIFPFFSFRIFCILCFLFYLSPKHGNYLRSRTMPEMIAVVYQLSKTLLEFIKMRASYVCAILIRCSQKTIVFQFFSLPSFDSKFEYSQTHTHIARFSYKILLSMTFPSVLYIPSPYCYNYNYCFFFLYLHFARA